MYQRHLVVMAKLPVAGRVKTRLAAGIGAVAAAAFYRRELASLLRRVGNDARWRTWLAVTPDSAVLSPVWPARLPRFAQNGGDLGQRMFRVMQGMPPAPVVIVGSDVPGLGPAQVAQAFGALGSHDAVFGPATDGGYYLVGLRRTPRLVDPFANVRWSGPHALDDTLANLNGLRIAMLEPLRDIDTADDLAELKR